MTRLSLMSSTSTSVSPPVGSAIEVDDSGGQLCRGDFSPQSRPLGETLGEPELEWLRQVLEEWRGSGARLR